MSKVLIVDDHPVIRMAMRVLLEKEGHVIVGETDNGVDALSLVKDLIPDLVVLDIGIPRLDGLEVISRISAFELPLKVLVLTGQSASLFAMRCMQAGASGFVCKQGGLAELISAVNAVVAGYNYFPSTAVRQTRRNSGRWMTRNSFSVFPTVRWPSSSTWPTGIRTRKSPNRCSSATRRSAPTRPDCC